MYEFKMPTLGAEMTHGKLIEWKIAVGDKVNRHDIIAVIDTDKAAIEVESFGEGVVEKLLVVPGEERIPVGTVLALIRESQAKVPQPESVSAVIDDHTASMKKVIAAAMSRSKREIPHYYLSTEIDLKNALAWLTKYNESHPVTERILMIALLIKAVIQACKQFPEFNGFYLNDEYKPSSAVHVGMAISLRGGGLIAPGLLNADKMNLAEIMKNLTDLVTRTRTGKLRSSEISDPTLTITNLGDLGVDSVFGVIYPPQVALIGFGKISSKQTVIATLSADHRASNGILGSRFLSFIANTLQEPENL